MRKVKCCQQIVLHYNAILVANYSCKYRRVVGLKMSLVEHLLQLETISMIDHWEQPSDVCYLKMTVLSCSIYHKLLKALVYKEGHHTKLNQKLWIYPKKHLLLQVRDWNQIICKFPVLLRKAYAYMNHQAGRLIDCN